MNHLHCVSFSHSRKEKEAGGEPRLITLHIPVKLNKKPGQFPVRASFNSGTPANRQELQSVYYQNLKYALAWKVMALVAGAFTPITGKL